MISQPQGLPSSRLRVLHEGAPGSAGTSVIYWMTGQRRLAWNWALDRAVAWAELLDLPLLIFEPLGLEYPHASLRFHTFAVQGMREHALRLEGTPVGYFPWVETAPGEGKGLLGSLAGGAAVVVTDDLPHFIYPGLLRGARTSVSCRLEAVDSAGVMPVRSPDRVFTTAFSFRRHLQKTLPDFLVEQPEREPDFSRLRRWEGLPQSVSERWAPADVGTLLEGGLEALPIDQTVTAVPECPGGRVEALKRLERFVTERLSRYPDRNVPDDNVGSELSPHLHWGHISGHEIVQRVLDSEAWNPGRLSSEIKGARAGWWGMSAAAEGFLDQVITWRELGLNGAAYIPDATGWGSLPEWAKQTMEEHADDARPELYTRAQFEAAATEDPLWNAAQRQLREEGMIHNYLRMLWGKKILEWSASPEEALETLFYLNDRYALDGRDPNSISGIMWTLGRYDRGWPERAIYGKIRSMSSASTRRKVSVRKYLQLWGPELGLDL